VPWETVSVGFSVQPPDIEMKGNLGAVRWFGAVQTQEKNLDPNINSGDQEKAVRKSEVRFRTSL
jgi:hypothetical protein